MLPPPGFLMLPCSVLSQRRATVSSKMFFFCRELPSWQNLDPRTLRVGVPVWN